jgi:hypothetical protein
MDSPSSTESEPEFEIWDMQSQSDSDTDLESNTGGVEPQLDSDTNLALSEINREVEFDGDSAYHSSREVLCPKKTNDPNSDDVAAFIIQQIAQHKKAGPAMANHAWRTKNMIETGNAYWKE